MKDLLKKITALFLAVILFFTMGGMQTFAMNLTVSFQLNEDENSNDDESGESSKNGEGEISLAKAESGEISSAGDAGVIFSAEIYGTTASVDSDLLLLTATASSEEIPDYDCWMAKSVFYGLEGTSGDSLYEIFLDFSEPIYKQLGGNILDDQILVALSETWSIYFNSEYRNQFMNEEKYVYEVLLMDYLKYDAENEISAYKFDSDEYKFATKLYSAVAKDLADDDLYEYIQGMTVEEAENLYQNIGYIGEISEAISVVKDFSDTVTTFTKAITDYLALSQYKEDKITLLKAARDACASFNEPNDAFIEAADEIIDLMQNLEVDYAWDVGIDYLWDMVLDDLWSALCKANPVLEAVSLGVVGFDVLFDTTDAASNNFKMALLYTLDCYMELGMHDAAQAFVAESSNSGTAETFLSCFKGYIEFQMFGNDYANTWLEDYIDGGVLASAIKSIFEEENIKSAEELMSLVDAQTSNMDSLLNLIGKYGNIYTGLYVDEVWTDYMYGTVAVDGVIFFPSSVTLSMDDRYIVNARISPSDATNKTIIYTSSDTSVLVVPENGGVATIISAGTVTVTATTEDGGYTATQTVTITEEESSNAITDSGSCGDNLYWNLYEDGTLYIYGYGEMTNYTSSSSVPWYSYREGITSVLIGNSVTSIGDYAFYSFASLKTFTLPDSITDVGQYSCAYCTALEELILSENLYSVSLKSFYGCSSLTTVEIPASLQLVRVLSEYGPFSNCASLKTVIFEDGTTIIPAGLFRGCSSLENIILPDSVTEIEQVAFSNCTSVVSLHLPDSIISIGGRAFEGCTSLSDLRLSANLEKLSSKAFANCTSLESIEIPKSLSTSTGQPFDGCISLKNITFESGTEKIPSYLFSEFTWLEKIEIPETVTDIGNYAFSGCTLLTEIVIPDSVEYIGSYAFYGCTNLQLATISANCLEIGEYSFAYCSSLGSIVIPNSVQIIYTGAFSGCTSLSEIKLSENLTTLYGYAFSDCTALQEIEIPKSLEQIKINGTKSNSPFYGCTSLQQIYFESGTTTIISYLFSGCSFIKQITIPDDITCIETCAFLNCTSLESIVLSDNLAVIYERAFENCSSLTTIEIPGSLRTAGVSYYKYGAFYGCDNLEEVIFEEGTVELASYVLYGCTSVKKVVIPESVTKIGDYAFYSCTSLEEISLPYGLTEIGAYAFAYCETLTTVDIPDSVLTIEYDAFYKCTNLKQVSLSDHLESLGNSTFGSCTSLTSILIPKSLSSAGGSSADKCTFFGCTNLSDIYFEDGTTTIVSYLFRGCTGIVEIVMPDSVEKIGSYAFADCENLEMVTMSENCVTIGIGAFSYCSNLKEIDIPDSVILIDDSAFSNCVSLEKVTLSANLESLGYVTFEGCTSLKEIEIPSSLTTVESTTTHRSPFYDCVNLSNISFAAGTTAIPDTVFAGCTGITEVDIPDTVTEIGVYAFYKCTNLRNVNISENCTTIGRYAFSYCEMLEEIIVPDSVTSLRDNAFSYCTNLKSIELSANIEYIGTSTFAYCTSLLQIQIPDKVTSVSEYAFGNCSGLQKITFTGDAPEFDNNVFTNVTATVYYPSGNATWTDEVMLGYGGTLTWVSYAPDAGIYTISDVLSAAISEAAEAISIGIRDIQQIVFNEDYEGELTFSADEDATGDKVLLLQLISDDTSDSGYSLALTDSSMIDENLEISFDITSSADGILIYGMNGDVTGDGAVNASDTLAILRGVSGRTTLDEVEKCFADVNLDGTVNSNDLLAVVKYVSGRTSTLY